MLFAKTTVEILALWTAQKPNLPVARNVVAAPAASKACVLGAF